MQAKPKSQTLDDERPRPDSPDQATYQHHLARYRFALGQMRGGERVLDAGCGTGYGSHVLRAKARSVLGVDYSHLAMNYAKRRYEGAGIYYAVMDCQNLACDSEAFDLVISFEVFEHMEDPDGFLRECVRVLKPGGRLILSTPNTITTDIHMSSIGMENPFHVNNHDKRSLQRILARHFSAVDLYGQRRRGNRMYSLLRSLDIFNLRLRLLSNSKRKRVQRSFGVPVGDQAVADSWLFKRSQIDQANALVAVCCKSA
ncbi:MAG: class I SAM-dependent methyltransferase [Acidipila sp.]|nr:class I SAM-dependent methyltransferase [Acidipila sp.]